MYLDDHAGMYPLDFPTLEIDHPASPVEVSPPPRSPTLPARYLENFNIWEQDEDLDILDEDDEVENILVSKKEQTCKDGSEFQRFYR